MNLRNETFLYVIKACTIAVLSYVIFRLLPLERVTSDFTAQVLNWFGIAAESYEVEGRIYLEYLQISLDCTALEIVAMFLGLILAVKASFHRKIVFSLTGSSAVFLANIGRISVVYFLLEKGVPWYLAHDIFSGGLSILAGMLFLIVSERHLPQINENLYTILDACEAFFSSRIR